MWPLGSGAAGPRGSLHRIELPGNAPPAPALSSLPGGDEVLGVEVYSLALYLLVHFYLRDAHKADSSDVWPSEIYSLGQMEPSSPMRMTSHSWTREQQGEAGAGVGGLQVSCLL